MAKCKYSVKGTGQCTAPISEWDKCKQDTCPMDKYTTENCNMKRKPKYKKIKAWACGSFGDTCALSVKTGPYKIPCTILINTKYLKDKK